MIEAVDMTCAFADANAYWTFLLELTALGPLIASLSDAARDHVRAAVDARLSAFTNASSGVSRPSRCWCGIAIR